MQSHNYNSKWLVQYGDVLKLWWEYCLDITNSPWSASKGLNKENHLGKVFEKSVGVNEIGKNKNGISLSKKIKNVSVKEKT